MIKTSLIPTLRRRLCALIFLTVLGTVSASAQKTAEYFYSTGTNSELGDQVGRSASGNPATWPSLNSQSSGEIIDGRMRLAWQKGANWTFLWTRAPGDSASYTLTPTFALQKDFKCGVALQVGFDGVFDHAQLPWPKGYWVSNESEFDSPLAQTEADGNVTLNASHATVSIPHVVTQVYVRVIVTDGNEVGKFFWIDSGTMVFTPLTGLETGSSPGSSAKP